MANCWIRNYLQLHLLNTRLTHCQTCEPGSVVLSSYDFVLNFFVVVSCSPCWRSYPERNGWIHGGQQVMNTSRLQFTNHFLNWFIFSQFTVILNVPYITLNLHLAVCFLFIFQLMTAKVVWSKCFLFIVTERYLSCFYSQQQKL